MTRDEFLEQLREEVGAAAARGVTPTRRRGQLPALLAAAAVVLVVAVAGFVALSPDPAAAGVEVLRDDRGVLIRLTGTGASPEAIERAAAAEGFALSVDEVPVGPSNVARFVSATGSELPELPELVELVDADGTSTAAGIRIPFEFDGEVALSVGRAAEEGEEWAVASDATQPGELLECEPVRDMTLERAVELADDSAGSVRIILRTTGQEIAPSDVASYPDATVDRIVSPSPDVLWIYAQSGSETLTPLSPARGC
ncbi:MAG: hypothetical protein ACK4V6_05140 [Microthrixaceae bacterium]